jgi:hypothetical protein
MWLIDKEQREGRRIQHGRNGREYALPELAELRVDGYCEETRTVYELVDCYWHRHACLPFRAVTTVCEGDTCGEVRKDDVQIRANHEGRIHSQSDVGMRI